MRRDDIQEFGAHNTRQRELRIHVVRRSCASRSPGPRLPRAHVQRPLRARRLRRQPCAQPERSKSKEITFAGRLAPFDWRLTGFDNRFDDLILYDASLNKVVNVASARMRGVEAKIEAAWLGVRWRGDGDLPAAARRGHRKAPALARGAIRILDVSRDFGAYGTAGIHVTASGARFDSNDEDAFTKLGGYAVVDARVRYRYQAHTTLELTATNLVDRHYQSAVGYDAPRRGVMLAVRFDAF